MVNRVAEVTLRTFSGFSEDRCGISAAGITYFALLSIFPLALVALSVAGYVFSSEADQDRLLDSVIERIPIDEEGGRDDLETVIRSIVDARGTLGVFGILSALYTGSALFTAVRVALNGVFRDDKVRPFILGKLIDIGMVLLFGLLLALSTGASFAIAFLGKLAEELAGAEFGALTKLGMSAASIVVATLISAGLFLLLYTRIPARPVSWKYAVPGAVLAAVLFEALKGGFAQYAANFGNYNATYGSLGFVILILAFIYFTSQVMLLGAEAARATSEVATGWPFPAGESKLAALRAKIDKALAMVRKVLRRGDVGAPDPTAAMNSERRLPVAAPTAESPEKHAGRGLIERAGTGPQPEPGGDGTAPDRRAGMTWPAIIAIGATAAVISFLRRKRDRPGTD